MAETYEYYFNKYGKGIHVIGDFRLYISNNNSVSTFVEFEKNGIDHRLDGPAVIWGSGIKEWYINGYCVTNKIREWSRNQGIDLDNLSDEDKVLIKLSWADYHG